MKKKIKPQNDHTNRTKSTATIKPLASRRWQFKINKRAFYDCNNIQDTERERERDG